MAGSSDKIIFRVDERFIFGTAHLGSYELHINELFTKNRIGKIKDFNKWEKIKSVDGRARERNSHRSSVYPNGLTKTLASRT